MGAVEDFFRCYTSDSVRHFSRTDREGCVSGSASLGRWHNMQTNAAIALANSRGPSCAQGPSLDLPYMIVDKAALLRSYNHWSNSVECWPAYCLRFVIAVNFYHRRKFVESIRRRHF